MERRSCGKGLAVIRSHAIKTLGYDGRFLERDLIRDISQSSPVDSGARGQT